MKYTITTYDKDGVEIVSRDYVVKNQDSQNRENYADQIESILEDSHTYLEEQVIDNKF
jgi:hypothetical protein